MITIYNFRKHKSAKKQLENSAIEPMIPAMSQLQQITSHNHTSGNHDPHNQSWDDHDSHYKSSDKHDPHNHSSNNQSPYSQSSDNHSVPSVNNNAVFTESKAYIPPTKPSSDPDSSFLWGLPQTNCPDSDSKAYQQVEDNVSDVVVVENTYYESVNDSNHSEQDEAQSGECEASEEENLYEPLAMCVSKQPGTAGGRATGQ